MTDEAARRRAGFSGDLSSWKPRENRLGWSISKHLTVREALAFLSLWACHCHLPSEPFLSSQTGPFFECDSCSSQNALLHATLPGSHLPMKPAHNSQILRSLAHKLLRIFVTCHFGSLGFDGLSTQSMSSKDDVLFIIVPS